MKPSTPRTRPLALAFGAIALLPAAGPATAQQGAQAKSLEEIVVTARRVEESMQRTPVSVSALGAELLDNAGIGDVTGIEKAVPNLNFTTGTGGGSSTVNAFIRGVGESDFILTTDPAVGLYIDGVYMARVFGANLELADIERIEVLRGPQGTLFGKNSIGGAISVVTKKPGGETSYSAKVTGGNFNHIGFEGYAETALSDTVAASVSLLARNADGWQDRPGADAGDVHVGSGRVLLDWKPSEGYESLLSLDYTDQDQNAYPNVMLTFDASVSQFATLWNQLNPGKPCCTPNDDIDESGAHGDLPHDEMEGGGVTWTNDWDLGAVALESITAYREMDALFGRDGDNSAYNYNGDVHDESHEQFSQELQLTGTALDERARWLLGLHYLQEQTDDYTQLLIIEGIGVSTTFDNTQDTESYAAFAHVTYDLSERLNLNLGIRYTYEEKELDQTITLTDFGIPRPFFVPGQQPADSCDYDEAAAHFDCEQDWDEFSPKGGLQYQITDDVMAYATVSRGFRSGGFNGRPFLSAGDLSEYEPETLTSYELGFKSQFAEDRVRLNGSAYFNNYEDIQITIVRAGSVAVENASEAEVKGFELELATLPLPQWTISAGAGYINDDSDGWVDTSGDFTDTELKMSPDWSFNLATEYRIELDSAGTIVLYGDMYYKDSYFIDGVNTPLLEVDATTYFDAGARWLSADGHWELGAFGKNLGDERVMQSGFDGFAFFGYIEGSPNPPRQYFVSLKYRS